MPEYQYINAFQLFSEPVTGISFIPFCCLMIPIGPSPEARFLYSFFPSGVSILFWISNKSSDPVSETILYLPVPEKHSSAYLHDAQASLL